VIQRFFDEARTTVAEREEVVYTKLGGGAGEDGAELGFAREGELVSDVALNPGDTERYRAKRGGARWREVEQGRARSSKVERG
jgi:hypothetical protein